MIDTTQALDYHMDTACTLALTKKRFELCRNSFMNVLNLGRTRWPTLNLTKLVVGANTHKSIESKNASELTQCFLSL
jgi:hypothetical protein